MAATSFSLQELKEAEKVTPAPPESLTASDGISLSYRRYMPAAPVAAVLFYHGGGAHSGASYQYIGNGLQKKFNTVVYMPDIRGHGNSGGARGDAPSPRQVWLDITTFIQHVHREFPQLPLFLGGHSSGGGMTLNYSSQPDREPVSGYIFLSPHFGLHSETGRPDLAVPFARVDGAAFAANAMSGGAEHGHDYAVQFSYPAELLATDPGLVGSITVNMSNALMPYAPFEQFAALDAPFGLLIGEKDELFQPEKVIAFASLAESVREGSQAGIIPDARHLSVLISAYETIGPWIAGRIKQSPEE